MRLSDIIWGLIINIMASYTATWGLVHLSGFLPGQWQHDLIWFIGMASFTPIFYATSRDIFSSYVKIQLEVSNEQ